MARKSGTAMGSIRPSSRRLTSSTISNVVIDQTDSTPYRSMASRKTSTASVPLMCVWASTIGMLNGPPVPACGASWMGCELLRHLDIEADCEIYIGRVIESGVASSTSGRIEPTIPAAELDVEGSAAGSTKNGRGRSKRATG